jgi:ADP-ribose pyrophosphatase YjhB (NUDIX family)
MSEFPIYKVGLVLWRAPHEVCLMQVKAKHAAEQHQVDFGLPKGTRRYFDGTQWLDARDAHTAALHADALEPPETTARTEAAEEIGLHDVTTPLKSLGPRPFQSRKGERYDIHWFTLQAPDDLVLGDAPDAHAVRWFTLQEVHAMAEAGRMNAGYAAVIEEVLS